MIDAVIKTWNGYYGSNNKIRQSANYLVQMAEWPK